MRKIDVVATATIFEEFLELPSEVQILMQRAVEAREKAYAPYSRFKVGAALLLENGQVILGNNQENAAYPSGMCAERVAIWKAGSEFPGVKVKLALVVLAGKPCLNTKLTKKNPLKFILWERLVKL